VSLASLPGATAPSEALDPARGCAMQEDGLFHGLQSMKKPILLHHSLAKWFLNEFRDDASTLSLPN